MNALKGVLCAGVVGAGLFALPAQEAEAGGFYVGIGHGHYGHGGYGHGGHAWHDTSHYDYHSGYAVPHHGHFDYAPGHYDFHGRGHVHHDGH